LVPFFGDPQGAILSACTSGGHNTCHFWPWQTEADYFDLVTPAAALPHPCCQIRSAALIYFVRHGETEFNLAGRYQGQMDSPLTQRGWRQANAAAALLAAHSVRAPVWTSPLPRALATARLVAGDLKSELHQDTRLVEVSFGVWEGMTRAEVAARWPDIRKQYPPHEWRLHAPAGEETGALLSRLKAVLDEASAPSGDVILVGHGVAGRLLRGLHAGLSLSTSLALTATQDVVYRLHPGGRIEDLPTS